MGSGVLVTDLFESFVRPVKSGLTSSTDCFAAWMLMVELEGGGVGAGEVAYVYAPAGPDRFERFVPWRGRQSPRALRAFLDFADRRPEVVREHRERFASLGHYYAATFVGYVDLDRLADRHALLEFAAAQSEAVGRFHERDGAPGDQAGVLTRKIKEFL